MINIWRQSHRLYCNLQIKKIIPNYRNFLIIWELFYLFLYSSNAFASWSGHDVPLLLQSIPLSFSITSSIFIPFTKEQINKAKIIFLISKSLYVVLHQNIFYFLLFFIREADNEKSHQHCLLYQSLKLPMLPSRKSFAQKKKEKKKEHRIPST